MGARPLLKLVPTVMESEPSCISQLMSMDNPHVDCMHYDYVHPLSPRDAPAPVFDSHKISLKVTCFAASRPKGTHFPVGNLSVHYCTSIVRYPTHTLRRPFRASRADVWWYSGGRHLYNFLPPHWWGRCALVSTIYPVNVLPASEVLKRLRAAHSQV